MSEFFVEKVKAPFFLEQRRVRRAISKIATREAIDPESTIVTGVHSNNDLLALAGLNRDSTYGMLLSQVVGRFPFRHKQVHDPLAYARGWWIEGADKKVGDNKGLFLYDMAFLELGTPEYPPSAYNAWRSFDGGSINRFLLGVVILEN